jgi:glycosyltransferase involved in cell wall biosynthesis
MPKWIERLGRVSDDQLAALYSEAQVFLLPSRAEGWGLPAAEAMASGAAVVTAANGGTEDFAISEVTALVVPPANPRAMAAAVLRILGDIELRNRLATAGAAMAGAMTWDRAFQELAVVLGISIN